MRKTPRIPRTIDKANIYFVNTTAYLQEGTPQRNGIRLGLLETEMAAWVDFYAEWAPLYLKYTDKENTRTTTIKDNLLRILYEFINFDRRNHVLDRIAASPNATIYDLGKFNIRKGVAFKEIHTVVTTPISEKITVALQPIGGGFIKIKCFSISGKRPAIYEGADCVQFAYLVGDVPPESVIAEGLMRDLSPRASFTLALGAENTKKSLYIYFRWLNTRHPELAGPWSVLHISVIV